MDVSTSATAISLLVYARCELRTVIRFLHSKGETPISIHRKLCEMYGIDCMSAKNMRKWCREFLEGRTEIHDEPKSERPSISDEVKEKLETELRDETWVYHFTPESKQQWLEWRHSHSPKKRKFKVTQFARNLMATVFWDKRGVLLFDFMPTGITINSFSYWETLKKLLRAIQNKRRGTLTKRVCLLHDNAWPHVSHETKALIDQYGWNVIFHPLNSPDLAPSDYHLFLNLKKYLRGKKMESDEKLKTEDTQYLHKVMWQVSMRLAYKNFHCAIKNASK